MSYPNVHRLKKMTATTSIGKWFCFVDSAKEEDVHNHLQRILNKYVHNKNFKSQFPALPRITNGPQIPMQFISFINDECQNAMKDQDETSLFSTPNPWRNGPPKIRDNQTTTLELKEASVVSPNTQATTTTMKSEISTFMEQQTKKIDKLTTTITNQSTLLDKKLKEMENNLNKFLNK